MTIPTTIKSISINLIMLLGFGFLFQGCYNPSTGTDSKIFSKSKKTIIIGLIDQPIEDWVRIYAKSYQDTATITKEGNFQFSIPLNEPVYFSLITHNKSIKIFLAPGDTLKIGFNPKQLPSSLLFKGKAANYNNYLKNKNQLMVDMAMPNEHLYSNNPDRFKHYIDSFYVMQKINFDMHRELMNEVSELFIQHEKASIWYERSTKMYEYLQINEDKYDISQDFYSFEKNTSPNQDSLLEVYEYKTYLLAYMDYLSIKDLKRKKNHNYSSAELTLSKMQFVVKKVKSSNVKNYLLTKLLSDQVSYYGYNNAKNLFQLYDYQCTDIELKTALLENYKKFKQLSELRTPPPIQFFDLHDKAFHLNDFLGQYIYIDVWATWCLPCRKQAPYFEEMAYKNKGKNVAFISLSIDKDRTEWVTFLNEKNKRTNQYLIKDVESFLDDYQIKTIPHFIIINEKGQIIDSNAPRPSEKNHDWLENTPNKDYL